MCRPRFPLSIIFLQLEEYSLWFLIVQFCWWLKILQYFISEKVIVLPLFSKDIFTKYRVLGWLTFFFQYIKDVVQGASLVVQWLRICLPMQGTRGRALVWEDPTCRRATGPVSHNYWACASGACAPQQERPRQWKARTRRWRVAPTCRN